MTKLVSLFVRTILWVNFAAWSVATLVIPVMILSGVEGVPLWAAFTTPAIAIGWFMLARGLK